MNWDYSDVELNSTTPRINRQKSARHIEIEEIDHEAKQGITLDPDGTSKSPKQVREEWLRQFVRFKPGWECWDPCIHEEPDQITRANSASELIQSAVPIEKLSFSLFRVGNYHTSYTGCDCPDFRTRGLPCKHMYSIRIIYS